MKTIFIYTLIGSFLLIFFVNSDITFAHCDGLDGPVVKAAQKALESEDVNPVLIWVKKEYENEIKTAFEKTLVVRKQSPEAKEMADMYFFETLVRIHRQGEGAPYTGLKPAGRDMGQAIPLADKSIETGSAEELSKLLTHDIHKSINHYFENVMHKKEHKKDDIKAGREFVESYVIFLHYVEGIYESLKISTDNHHKESKEEAHSLNNAE